MEILYHGSKSGIIGDIKPKSHSLCDFGSGFYMGNAQEQVLTLICNFPNAKFYTVEVDLTDLKILNLDIGIDWALLIAYYRGKMETVKNHAIYKKYSEMANGFDMITGHIANDRMFVVLDRFFSGDITDTALIKYLSALKLGKQYVAITDKACEKIRIAEEESLTDEQREKLRETSSLQREAGIRLADEICRKNRRNGRFFDEIILEG